MKKYRQLYLTLILGFILGIRSGQIALWREGGTKPVHIFPYQVEMLPQEAQDALAEGIPIESIRQLEELAENYLS